MDSHNSAIQLLGEEGEPVDCAMAAVITATSAMSNISTARGMAEIVEAINNLNASVQAIGERMGVKLPSDSMYN